MFSAGSTLPVWLAIDSPTIRLWGYRRSPLFFESPKRFMGWTSGSEAAVASMSDQGLPHECGDNLLAVVNNHGDVTLAWIEGGFALRDALG